MFDWLRKKSPKEAKQIAPAQALPARSVPEQSEIPPGFTLRHTLRGHRKIIGRIAWSPDGRMLAVPSGNNTIRLWDAKTGKALIVLGGHGGDVYSVAWSPDGRTLVSVSSDNIMRLWNMSTRKEISALELSNRAYVVAWSPDERIASGDRVVQLWDAQTQRVLRTWNVQQGAIHDLVWSPNGTLALAPVNAAGKVRLWDTTSEEPVTLASPHTHHVTSVAWSPDGRLLASGGNNGTLQLRDIVAQRQIVVLEGHTDDVSSISFSADGRLLASKSVDGTVRLWRTDSWQAIARLRAYPNNPSCRNSMALESPGFYPISVKRIGSK